mgnify:CR=1 FL=1|jgi:hypothetical protein
MCFGGIFGGTRSGSVSPNVPIAAVIPPPGAEPKRAASGVAAKQKRLRAGDQEGQAAGASPTRETLGSYEV